MDFLFHFSVPLISSVIALAILIFFFCFGRKSKYDYPNSFPVIEVLTSLTKICPIGSCNKWKLLPYDYGSHRCWMQKLIFPFMKNNLNLYGSAIILNSSSANIGSLVADMTKWVDWNPFYSSQLIVKSFNDKQLRKDHYMEAEQVVSIVRNSNSIQPHTSMYRFHAFSENKVGWILFWNAKKFEFMFFLIQPVKNKNECPQCVLTHIVGTQVRNSSSFASIVTQRLRNIQDYVSHSSITLVPMQLTSSNQNESSIVRTCQTSSQDNIFSVPAIRARKRDVRNTVFILVPFISSTYWFWKEKTEFKLGVKNIESSQSDVKSQVSSVKQNPNPTTASKNCSAPKHPMRRAASDVGIKPQSLKDLTQISKSENTLNKISETKSDKSSSEDKTVLKSKEVSDTTSEDPETNNNSRAVNQHKVTEKNAPKLQLRSLSETALNNSEIFCDMKEAEHNNQNNKRLENIDEKPEDKMLAMHDQDQKEMFNSSISDFELLESYEFMGDTREFTENRIAGFMTQGNYGASELQAEVLLASQFDDCTNSGNYQLCGGWQFHSHHKGLSVLSKATSSQFLQITSFLCQTELPVSPKDVWKFVKCPQFRFICDETVKSVEVLEKLSSSQKLIHTYHEVGGIIRKELVDFCLLQTERVELNKCYSCFYSVEFDKCPFMNYVTRGTLRPSGWIVEEVENNIKRSKVTYMIQMISSPDSMLIQELSSLVPQSVHNLKNYITTKPM